MSRRKQVYEGKAKVLFEGPEPGTLVQYFKDDATAFNNQKKGTITGKGVLNNRISEFLMTRLAEIGIPTHFVRRLNMREQLVREVEIIPIEVVVRNVAAGSLAERFGIAEGTRAAALDRRVLLQERRARRSDGVRRAHHRLRLGDDAGSRRDHADVAADQRFPDRPVPRHRHQAGRLQARVRPALSTTTRCGSCLPTRSARTIAGCGTSRPTRRWTRTASARISAASRRPIRKSRAASASCPRAARRDVKGPQTVQ